MPAGASHLVRGHFRKGNPATRPGFSCTSGNLGPCNAEERGSGGVLLPGASLRRPGRTAGKSGADVSADRMLNAHARRNAAV